MAAIYYISTSFWHVLLAETLCGIGGSVMAIGWQTFAISIPKYRTENLSALHLTTCGIRGLYAPILDAVLIDFLGVRTTFLIAGFSFCRNNISSIRC